MEYNGDILSTPSPKKNSTVLSYTLSTPFPMYREIHRGYSVLYNYILSFYQRCGHTERIICSACLLMLRSIILDDDDEYSSSTKQQQINNSSPLHLRPHRSFWHRHRNSPVSHSTHRLVGTAFSTLTAHSWE